MTKTADILEKIRPLLVQILDLDTTHPLSAETSIEELGLTSMDLLDLGMAIEEEFSVQLSEHDLSQLATVGDLAHALSEQTRS